MPERSYLVANLKITETGGGATREQIRDLQRDLRALGYLRRGIDGVFGSGTAFAVKALQNDLLTNDGTGSDGTAPVSIKSYNKGRVSAASGVVDFGLAQCISDMLDDPSFPTLPNTADPAAENRKMVATLKAIPSPDAPIPFVVGILMQESGLKHFNEPPHGDEDTYIVVGLDTNAADKSIVTSRGYGAGQYTLFHHPPRREEVTGFILDVAKNVSKTIRELRDKFDRFIVGSASGTRTDDRIAEIGSGPLRICKYDAADSRYMKDCQQCLKDAGTINIQSGVTTLHRNTTQTYEPTQYYASGSYQGVPNRSLVGCDWPYAVRRYNGSGANSYHYQVRILLHMTKL
jgi:peptidoglycan hydrolase-like protein with peptidoglycan-binding domain